MYKINSFFFLLLSVSLQKRERQYCRSLDYLTVGINLSR